MNVVSIAGLAWLADPFILAAAAVPCVPETINMNVATSTDLDNFITAMECNGTAVFDVTWSGHNQISERIEVSEMKNVTITGVALLDTPPAAANDDGIDTSMFFVHGESTLSLRNLALDGGNSTDGAAVSVVEKSVVNVFDCTFTNNIAVNGGGIYASESFVNIDGKTSFINNSATNHNTINTGGGAIYADDSIIKIDGITTFTNNSAFFDGGAILLDGDSEIYINGITDFFNNQAGDDGGAISALPKGIIYVTGITTFANNTAKDDGGAIKAQNGEIHINGTAYFIGNSAGDSGGATRVNLGQELSIFGEGTVFTGNSAVVGGAVYTTGCLLGIYGGVEFAYNSAFEFGGAVYSLEDDPVALEGNLSFVRNSAGPGGGALSIGDPGKLSIAGANFTWNTADVGGAVSVNAVRELDREFKDCRFEYNTATATDGGGMYFFTSGGSDNVDSSLFHGNRAAKLGGAIYHREALKLVDITFWENTAGDGSLAVQGSAAATLNNVSFVNNTFHCALGEYLYDNTSSEEDASSGARFQMACAGCSAGGNTRSHDGVEVQHPNRIPTCEPVPNGVRALSSGTTVENITLEAGFFRVSKESRDILECHRQRSCVGGNDVNNYCAAGYEGPYCATCAKGFASGTAYNCRQCSNVDRSSAVGLAVAMAVVLVLVVVALAKHFMREIDSGDDEGAGIMRGSLVRRCIHLERVFVKVFPLTAVKIVVVVWQIVSQFATIAGDVYPEEYDVFIDNLSFINLDIGAMLSYYCLVSTDFYDHLLLNTIAPLVVLMLLACTYSVAKIRNQGSAAAMREVQHKHVSAGLFVAFLVYSSVSFTIFQTFVCEPLDDGVSYLRADYNLTCDSDRYAVYKAYAILMVCVYPIGLPAILAWWLLRNRVDLKKANRSTNKNLEPFSGLWSPYRPSRYYYEVVESGRRIALTATASFVPPNGVAQIAVVLLVAAVLLFISESMSPFSSSINMGLYRWGNGIVLASMYVAFLLKIDTSGEESSEISAFGAVLIASNVFLVVTVIVQSILMAFEWKGAKKTVELVHPIDVSRVPQA